jgi:hypothetical protein
MEMSVNAVQAADSAGVVTDQVAAGVGAAFGGFVFNMIQQALQDNSQAASYDPDDPYPDVM